MAKSKKTTDHTGLTLDAVFQLADRIRLSEAESGIITVLEKQDHRIQTALRRLKFRIPEYKKTELDEYGSFIFKNIDGKTSVEGLGQTLKEHFGPSVEPVYDRLAMYLHHLEKAAGLIERVPAAQ